MEAGGGKAWGGRKLCRGANNRHVLPSAHGSMGASTFSTTFFVKGVNVVCQEMTKTRIARLVAGRDGRSLKPACYQRYTLKVQN